MYGENWWPGVRGLLGTVAGLDIVGGLLRAFPPGGLPDGALGALVSLAIGVLAGGVFGWALVGAVLYGFAHRVYPDATGFPADERGFRVLFTGSALVFAMTFDATGSAVALLVTLFGVVVVAGVGFVGYLSATRERRLLDPEDPFVQPVEQFSPFAEARPEIEADLARSGWLGVLGRISWLAAIALVAALPCVLAGFAAIVLERTFPLPDLLVLGWAVLGVVPSPVRPDFRRRTDDLEIESQVYDVVQHATSNTKAMMLTIFIVGGLFVSGGLMFVAISVAGSVAGDVVAAGPGFTWTVTGVVVSMLASGCYQFWFWLRQFKRIGPFVERWEGKDDEPSLPPRPLGWTLPPTLVAGAVTMAVAGWDIGPVRAIAASWPALVAFLGVCVVLTGRWGSRELGREDVAVIVSLVVAAAGIGFMAQGDAIETAIRAGTVPASMFDWNVVTAVTLLVLVSFLPDASRHQDESEGVAEYSLPVYLAILALVSGGLSTVAYGAIGTLTTAMAVVAFLSAIVLTLTKRYGL